MVGALSGSGEEVRLGLADFTGYCAMSVVCSMPQHASMVIVIVIVHVVGVGVLGRAYAIWLCLRRILGS